MMLKKLIAQVALAALPLAGLAAERPNIVFLLTDDQSLASLGCYGNADVQTPHLDALAREGMAFDRHYASTAICMASRASIMTGQFEFKTGCNFEHGDMMLDTWKGSYPMLLRESGYRTAFAGKFGFALKVDPDSKKKVKNYAEFFDVWAGASGQSKYATKVNPALSKYAAEFPHATLAYGAFGRDFIKESAAGDQPFCLSISFKSPHRPNTPDPRFDDVYRDQTFSKPANFGREFGTHFAKQSQADRQYERFQGWNYDSNYDAVMATYYQQIYGVDQAVGMIRDALKEAGVDQNTVVIFASDNGYMCGSHGYASKVLPYEESSRVPLIVMDPREENSGKALRATSLTGHCDIAPTVLALAGVAIPEKMDGHDLMALYRDPQAEIHESLPLMNVWGVQATHALSVVTSDQKYIHWGYAATGYEVTEELYHLGKDPLELENLAENPENNGMLESMQTLYDGWVQQWQDECAKYNDYERYGTLFDRTVPWTEKAALID